MDDIYRGRRVLPDLTAGEPSANTEQAKAFLKAGGTVSQWLELCASAAKHKPNKRRGGAAPRHTIQYSPHYS
jgi:hypothetical protein